jgi:hypothetical protein
LFLGQGSNKWHQELGSNPFLKMVRGKRSGDDDTSKDGVVIQRVIREVDGGSSYTALTKTNYSDWMLLIKVKLKA